MIKPSCFLAAAALLLASTLAAADPGIPKGRLAGYDPVGCKKTPKDAIKLLSPPAAPYALIYCSPTGQTVAPVDGYVWFPVDQPGQLFLFAAPTSKEGDVKRAYFTHQHSHLVKDKELEEVNRELRVGYKIDQTYQDVIHLDVTAADGKVFNIFFFVGAGKRTHILGCVDECKTSVLLREYSFAEAKQLTSVSEAPLK